MDLWFNGYGPSVLQDEKVLEVEYSDGQFYIMCIFSKKVEEKSVLISCFFAWILFCLISGLWPLHTLIFSFAWYTWNKVISKS